MSSEIDTWLNYCNTERSRSVPFDEIPMEAYIVNMAE